MSKIRVTHRVDVSSTIRRTARDTVNHRDVQMGASVYITAWPRTNDESHKVKIENGLTPIQLSELPQECIDWMIVELESLGLLVSHARIVLTGVVIDEDCGESWQAMSCATAVTEGFIKLLDHYG